MNADATEPVTPAARTTPTRGNDWGPGGPQSSRPDGFGTIKTGGLIAKLVLIGLADAVGLWAIIRMISRHEWTFAIPTIVALGLLNLIYLGGRFTVPGKYLFPGTVFLAVFAIYPVGYTVYNSMTNYGTGNNLSKSQAVTQIQNNSIGATTDAVRYKLQVLAKGSPTGELAFLLIDADGKAALGTRDGTTPVDAAALVKQGTRTTIEGYSALNLGQANSRKAEINAFTVPSPVGEISNDGFTAAFAKTQGLTYDAATNTVIDAAKKITYHEQDGYFVDDTGKKLLPGWRAFVGLANYQRLNSDSIRGPFVRVFLWTLVFSVMSVVTTFALGLLLALVFANERMKGRRYYRLAMIVPYALPSFMTALVWKGMLNERYGIINRFFHLSVPWLDGQWAPYFSILLVNLWLGFPYMFLVCTGALQGIPSDLKEAAVVDGATGFKAFRRITFPLLLIAVAPLLIASFAFNFNNFNIVYLLTEGRPSIPGSDAGRTDILITYMYKLAFGGGRGADYGFASAVSMLIFVIVAGISAFSFRFTKAFEEIK